MLIKEFIDYQTATITYVVSKNNKSIIIDPVLNYDPKTGTINYFQAEEIIKYIEKNKLEVLWILETHAHADHLSASQYLKDKTGAKIGVSNGILNVQNVFNKVFNMNSSGDDFDILIKDRDVLDCGGFKVEAIATPGHTPACMTYKIENNLFVGDTIFMHDVGTARCDFPGGSAEKLYESIKLVLAFDENSNVFFCHDYPPEKSKRDFTFKTTIKEVKEKNIHVNEKISKDEFVRLRTKRDKTLDNPKLLFQSIQVNIKAGKLPEKETNNVSYLKLPLKDAFDI